MRLNTSTDPQVGFRPPGALDAANALAPYSGAFGARQAAHLTRRAGFGATPAEVQRLVALGPNGAVDAFLHPSVADLDEGGGKAADARTGARMGGGVPDGRAAEEHHRRQRD